MLSSVAGNGWGDGDFAEWLGSGVKSRACSKAMQKLDDARRRANNKTELKTRLHPMTNQITHTYDGTLITYDEKNNLWRFELRGRDRSSESLAKAKEAIDKPVADKSPPFQRVKAWRKSWNADPILVEVTGIAESSPYSRSHRVWTTFTNGKREKVSTDELYEVSAKNDAKVAQIIALSKQIQQLVEKKGTILLESLKLTIPE